MHVVLFHSALGLRGVEHDLADELRHDGHHVTVPDLYDGRSAQTLEDGLALMHTVGWTHILARARQSLRGLPDDAVLVGVSMGAGVVSEVWRDRPATPAVLLIHGYAPIPDDVRPGVRAALHVAEDDPFAPSQTVVDWQTTADVRGVRADVYRYPGLGHFFTDPTSGDYDASAAATVLERARGFLEPLD
jgi:dienelactone hydrolase